MRQPFESGEEGTGSKLVPLVWGRIRGRIGRAGGKLFGQRPAIRPLALNDNSMGRGKCTPHAPREDPHAEREEYTFPDLGFYLVAREKGFMSDLLSEKQRQLLAE